MFWLYARENIKKNSELDPGDRARKTFVGIVHITIFLFSVTL